MLKFTTYDTGTGWTLHAVTSWGSEYASADLDPYQKRTQVRVEFNDGTVVWCRSKFWAKHVIAERFEQEPE